MSKGLSKREVLCSSLILSFSFKIKKMKKKNIGRIYATRAEEGSGHYLLSQHIILHNNLL